MQKQKYDIKWKVKFGNGLHKKMLSLKVTSNKLKIILKNRQKCPSKKKGQILLSRKSVSVSELIPQKSGKNDRRPIATSIDGKTLLENEKRPDIRRAPKITVQDWEIFL